MSSERHPLGTRGDVFASTYKLLNLVESASSVDGPLQFVITTLCLFVADERFSSRKSSERPLLGTSVEVFASHPIMLEISLSVLGRLPLMILFLVSVVGRRRRKVLKITVPSQNFKRSRCRSPRCYWPILNKVKKASSKDPTIARVFHWALTRHLRPVPFFIFRFME